MIHKLAECPHCGSVVALDPDASPELFYNPDTGPDSPCEHLVGWALCISDSRPMHNEVYMGSWEHDVLKAHDPDGELLHDGIISESIDGLVRFAEAVETVPVKDGEYADGSGAWLVYSATGGAVFAKNPAEFIEQNIAKWEEQYFASRGGK